jgi:hypothetical protein
MRENLLERRRRRAALGFLFLAGATRWPAARDLGHKSLLATRQAFWTSLRRATMTECLARGFA